MRKVVLILLIISLGACSTRVNHIRFKISEKLDSSMQILASKDLNFLEKGMNAEGARRQLESYAKRARQCGATTRIFKDERSEQLFLQENFVFESPDELDVVIACVTPKQIMLPTVYISKSGSLFSTKYLLKVRKEISKEFFKDGLPREMSLLCKER